MQESRCFDHHAMWRQFLSLAYRGVCALQAALLLLRLISLSHQPWEAGSRIVSSVASWPSTWPGVTPENENLCRSSSFLAPKLCSGTDQRKKRHRVLGHGLHHARRLPYILWHKWSGLHKNNQVRKKKCAKNKASKRFAFSTIRNLYAHCIQSEEGQHLGCITDRMGDGSYLTVPVYATICSAMCYESKANMERVKKCPYPGFRKHNPILSKLFWIRH